MNEESQANNQQPSIRFNYINYFILVFTGFLLIIDFMEWKRIISAWRFGLNNSIYLFDNCHDSDLEFKSASLFYSTLTDLIIFTCFLIISITRPENQSKPLKLTFKMGYFFYGPLLFFLCIFSVLNSDKYVFVCDKDKLIGYFLYYGAFKNETLKYDLFTMERSISGAFQYQNLGKGPSVDDMNYLAASQSKSTHLMKDEKNHNNENDLIILNKIKSLSENPYAKVMENGSVKLNTARLERDYLKKSTRKAKIDNTSLTVEKAKKFEKIRGEYRMHRKYLLRKSGLEQSKEMNVVNDEIIINGTELNNTIIDMLNSTDKNSTLYLNANGDIPKDEFEHIIVNTKILSGLFIVNTFIGFLLSCIIVLVFGNHSMVNLFKDSYLSNYKGSQLIEHFFWKFVLLKTTKKSLISSMNQQINQNEENNGLDSILSQGGDPAFNLMHDYFNNYTTSPYEPRNNLNANISEPQQRQDPDNNDDERVVLVGR